MFVVAYMIFQFARMEKSGTVNVFNALEHTGEVYLSIPERLEGRGKIHIVVDGTLHEFDAETKGTALPTGSQVKCDFNGDGGLNGSVNIKEIE